MTHVSSINLADLQTKDADLRHSLAALKTEEPTILRSIGQALVDDGTQADGLRERLRSVRDEMEAIEAALGALRPRLALAAAESRIARRVAAAETCRAQLDSRDQALADLDRALRDVGEAYDRLTGAIDVGVTAARLAEDGDRVLGRAAIAYRTLASLYPDRALVIARIYHAIWYHAPELAKAMRAPTLGHAKHRPVTETLGHRFPFEPEALGETLRELAVKQVAEPTRSVLPISVDGVRIVQLADLPKTMKGL